MGRLQLSQMRANQKEPKQLKKLVADLIVPTYHKTLSLCAKVIGVHNIFSLRQMSGKVIHKLLKARDQNKT